MVKIYLFIIMLLALEAPWIVNNLSDQRMNVSDSTMLMCEARGTPTPNITWTKDNQTVIKGSGERLFAFGQDFEETEFMNISDLLSKVVYESALCNIAFSVAFETVLYL